jgi:hypothetical protein
MEKLETHNMKSSQSVKTGQQTIAFLTGFMSLGLKFNLSLSNERIPLRLLSPTYPRACLMSGSLCLSLALLPCHSLFVKHLQQTKSLSAYRTRFLR